jgi:hypothetical protein
VEKNVEKQRFSLCARASIPQWGRFAPGEGRKMPDICEFCSRTLRKLAVMGS